MSATPWKRQRETSVLAGLITLLLFCFLVIALRPGIGDEGVHVDQIRMFLARDFRQHGAVTQIPGYHALIAALAGLTGLTELPALRTFSFLIAAGGVIAFYVTARFLDRRDAKLPTIQLVFLPILFPFYFLVYTDVLSLVCVVLAFYWCIRRSPGLTALWGLLSVLARQNNILWVCFFWLLLLLQEEPLRRTAHATFTLKKEVVLRWLRSSWHFPLIFAGFAVFVLKNGGIAIGDPSAHPFPSVHLGNVWFMLFLFFFLFLPIHLRLLPRIWAFFRRYPIQIVAGVLLLLNLFLFTFVVDHATNQPEYGFFLRNRMLNYFDVSLSRKLFFFIPIAWSALTLCVLQLRSRWYLMVYPVTILFVSSSWLIEQRYYLIPFALFLLMRERFGRITEYALATVYVTSALGIFAGVTAGWFFL